MKISVRLLAGAVVSFLFLGLVACSDTEVDSLERVRKAGEISFAMSGGYPPFNFMNYPPLCVAA